MRISVLTTTIRGYEGLGRPAIGLLDQSLSGHQFEWLYEIHDPSEPPDFNASMNRLLKKSTGELIIFLQDFILPNKHGIEIFVEAYQNDPNTFYTAPVGKTLDDKTVEWDWRKDRWYDQELNSLEWEIDWACAPREALIKIGGFDEELDKYWGFDNVNLGVRAEMAGYKFRNIIGNPAMAYDHNKKINHPYQKLRNPDFHNMRLNQIIRGEVKVSYV